MLCSFSFSAPDTQSSSASCFLSGGFPKEGWRRLPRPPQRRGHALTPPSPNMHSETCLVFCSCCVSCESQVAMERFFQMYALVTGAIQSLWKAVQTLPLIFMVLCHLLHLRSHPCSLLLRFQEILNSFSAYIKEHQM